MSLVHRVEELVEEQGNALVGKAQHWERVPLHWVASVINGFPFPSGGFNNSEGEPVIRIRDVTSGQVGTYFKGKVTEAPTVNHGDLVIGMDGDFNSRLWPSESALMNQRVCKVVPNDEYYSKELLAYAIPGYLKLVNDHTSAVTVKHLSSRTVQDLPLPLPPRSEQDRLVSKLDELFSRIDEGERALERVQKLVERYRQSVLKAAVTGELTREWREMWAKSGAPIETGEALLARILTARREAWEQAEQAKMKAKGIRPRDDKWKHKYLEPASPETSELPDLPEGWVWASVNQVCGEFGNGLSKKPSHTPPGYPILRISAVRPLAVDAEDVRYYPSEDIGSLDGFLVKTGDLLFTRYNGSKELVGVSGVFHGAEPVLHPDKLIRARVVSEHLISPKYLAITLNCGWSKKHLDQWVKTSAGQHGIAGSDIKRAPFPLPSFAEQLQILEIVEVALSKCVDAKMTCSAQLRRSSGVRQSILKSAFAGALVAQDSSDEPAATLIERIASERKASPAKPNRSPKIKKNASK